MTTQRQQITGPEPLQGFSAMEIMDTYLEDMGISEPDEVQPTRQAVMMVAEYLHDIGKTLAWEELDPSGFFQRIAFMNNHDREGVALMLMGFYVWLCARDFVLSERAQTILSELVGQFPASEILGGLHKRSLQMLEHLADMPLLH